ncbi:hypothetical protein FisN_7Lh079 [Fistulifera solaris]|uniref:Acyltransferase 3 domain-containing protein n=1 Tax=Fistulifera solaris TaxID=1519565 RepID=A0A1Z5JCK8_FISSO|nr:hypothetical protein FisN_7Lh079 [Fistulifera solaris]|eukprot:GAX11709.1 hypothetical protein FisN_7Lh079 [Fistulifera solaris]
MITREIQENSVAAPDSENVETPHGIVIDEWSSAFTIASSKNSSWPVSSSCRQALHLFLLSRDYDALAALSIAVEASSHPSGLTSLQSQPWVYSGGGLGNKDECLSIQFNEHDKIPFHSCFSGLATNRAASLPFASLCIPANCTALDLASHQMLPILQHYLVYPQTTKWLQDSQQLRDEYVTVVERVHDINSFLGTGWVCGEFQMPWNPLAVAPFAFLCILLLLCVARATWKRHSMGNETSVYRSGELSRLIVKTKSFETGNEEDEIRDTEDAETTTMLTHYNATPHHCAKRVMTPSTTSEYSIDSSEQNDNECMDTDALSQTRHDHFHWHWSCAFDLKSNLQKLVSVRDDRTNCLDGLRVGSLLWILLGHVMAIESSTGAGYSNPAAFLPPSGWTTTITGQLLFSSRMAVDTFFCISGFLLVHNLDRKMNWGKQNWGTVVCGIYPIFIISRAVRILPIYSFCLWFYMFIAPHLGSGPFWYQWQGLLMPCQGFHWVRNLLFSNNLIDGPITETCFYHSWYLAVDMQLYAFCSLLLLGTYNHDSHRYYRYRVQMIAALFMVSFWWTAYCTWTRGWSINTFDGVAVVRYDVEGYANPLVRAQSYLAGMMVACCVSVNGSGNQTINRSRRRNILLLVALAVMTFVVFITAAGAYAQRPCQYNEWPRHGRCGSTWSPFVTFLYTAFSRTMWITGLCVVIYSCITDISFHDESNMVTSFLSWKVWTFLSNLSFGAYLIHPIVIFIWQLGGRQKAIFSLLSFSLTNFSIAVVSFVASLIVALLVELPAAQLWQRLIS